MIMCQQRPSDPSGLYWFQMGIFPSKWTQSHVKEPGGLGGYYWNTLCRRSRRNRQSGLDFLVAPTTQCTTVRVTRALKLNDCDDDGLMMMITQTLNQSLHPFLELCQKKDNSTPNEGTAHIQETNFISWEVKGGCFPVYFYRISFKVFPYWKLFFCTHTYWPSLFS